MFGSHLEIKHFEQQILAYEEKPVEKGRILLYGHSLFTRCKPGNRWGHPNVEECVLRRDGSPAVLNHGFGTSSADDLLYYYHRMVTPYEPQALCLATANNDFANQYEAEQVVDILARVAQYAKAEFPGIPVFCFSYWPMLKQKGMKTASTERRDRYNVLLKQFCEENDCQYVSLIDQPWLFENAEDVGDYDKIREDIYCEDRTHPNTMGYEIFFDFLRDLLKDLL